MAAAREIVHSMEPNMRKLLLSAALICFAGSALAYTTNFSTRQIYVTSGKAVQIAPARTERGPLKMWCYGNASAVIFIGQASTLSTSTGYPLPATPADQGFSKFEADGSVSAPGGYDGTYYAISNFSTPTPCFVYEYFN